jgi:hypothetical protein
VDRMTELGWSTGGFSKITRQIIANGFGISWWTKKIRVFMPWCAPRTVLFWSYG